MDQALERHLTTPGGDPVVALAQAMRFLPRVRMMLGLVAAADQDPAIRATLGRLVSHVRSSLARLLTFLGYSLDATPVLVFHAAIVGLAVARPGPPKPRVGTGNRCRLTPTAFLASASQSTLWRRLMSVKFPLMTIPLGLLIGRLWRQSAAIVPRVRGGRVSVLGLAPGWLPSVPGQSREAGRRQGRRYSPWRPTRTPRPWRKPKPKLPRPGKSG